MFQGRFRCRSFAVRCFSAASNPPDRHAIASVSLDRLRLLLRGRPFTSDIPWIIGSPTREAALREAWENSRKIIDVSRGRAAEAA